MQIVSIEKREITVVFDPEDCLILAAACRMAERRYDPSDDGPDPGTLLAFGSVFDAAAMAGASYSYLHDPEIHRFTLAHVKAVLRPWQRREPRQQGGAEPCA